MKLVSVTISNNRAGVIQRMVESVNGWVDGVVILDTGITDQTLDIAKEFAGNLLHVVPFTWTNDFAAARNAALDAAATLGADWAILLDTDEWLDTRGEDIRARCEEADKTGEVRHFVMKHMSGSYLQPRVFKLPRTGKFEGPTHEAYSPYDPAILLEKAVFCDEPKTPAELEAKLPRDLAILEKHAAENPAAPRWWYYLGDTYDNLGRTDEAINAFIRCASLRGWDEESAWACYRAAACYIKDNKFVEAIDMCAVGLARHSGIAELAWLAGYCNHQLGAQAKAIYWAKMCEALGKHKGIGKRVQRISFQNQFAQWEGPYDIMRSAYKAIGENKESDMADIAFGIAKKSRELEGKC